MTLTRRSTGPPDDEWPQSFLNRFKGRAPGAWRSGRFSVAATGVSGNLLRESL